MTASNAPFLFSVTSKCPVCRRKDGPINSVKANLVQRSREAQDKGYRAGRVCNAERARG